MLNRIFNSLVASTLSLLIATQPIYAQETYFRYKGLVGLTSPIIENPEETTDPENFDIEASFMAMVGRPGNFQLPLKLGKYANSWSVSSGNIPAGLTLNPSNGTISGTPTGRGDTRATIIARSASTGDISRINTEFTVLEATANTSHEQIFAHADRYFEEAIVSPGEVASWEVVSPLPAWASTNGNSVRGTPPAGTEGTFSFALQGKDYADINSKLVYGEIIVSEGPVVGEIADVLVDAGQPIVITPSASNIAGSLTWHLEDGVLPHNLAFNSATGMISGNIPTFDTHTRIQLSANDSDGTKGLSNYFNIGTRDAQLDLANIPDQRLFVGDFESLSMKASGMTGVATWSISAGELPTGLTIDPSTGVISGTPTVIETKENIVVSVETSTSFSASSNPFTIEVVGEAVAVSVDPTNVRVDFGFTTPAPVIDGGQAPYTFSLAAGQPPLNGLTLDPTTGQLSGQIPDAGNKTATLVVTDSKGSTSDPFLVGINVFNNLGLSVTPAEQTLIRTQTAANITPVVEPNSIIGSVTYELVGALPDGLSFNTTNGTITGTPTQLGSFTPLQIQITDGSGETAYSNTFTINVENKDALSVSLLNTEFKAQEPVSRPLAEAQNAFGEVTWRIVQGALPDGLSLAADGIISGTPTTEGVSSNIVIAAIDTDLIEAASAPFTIIVTPPGDMEITSGNFEWSVNRPFSMSLQTTNYVDNVAYTIVDGNLPSGANLAPSGVISGIVTTPSVATVTLRATDTASRTAEKEITFRFIDELSISLDAEYEIPSASSALITPTVSNAIGGVNFTYEGTLPTGLVFNPTSGEISGIPTASWDSKIVTVAVTDSTNSEASAITRITIGSREPVSIAYNFPTLTMNSSDGLPQLPVQPTNAIGSVSYTLEGTLPNGVTFNTADGSFNGTPTQTGSFPGIFVTGTDSTGSSDTSQEITIVVQSGVEFGVLDYSINARVGEYFTSDAPNVQGAIGSVSFAAVTERPLGLDVDPVTGAIYGIPSEIGSHVATLRATDSLNRTVDYRVTIDVVGALGLSYSPTTTQQHADTTITPTVTNKVGHASFTVQSGSLPAGLSLNPTTGVISGRPTTQGTYQFHIRAIDEGIGSNSITAGPIQVVVEPRLPLSIATDAEQTVLINTEYSLTLQTQNGIRDVSWTHTGSLPSGLSLSSSGKVTGEASALGTYNATLTATDDAGGTATKAIKFTVITNGLPLELTNYNVKTKVGLPFESPMPRVRNAVGDTVFYTSDLDSLGLTVDPQTGKVSGSFTEPMRVTGNIHVTDITNRATSRPITIDVVPNLTVSVREEINVSASEAMKVVTPTAENVIGTVQYRLLGSTLPAGMSFNATTGAISGTPTVAAVGNYSGYFVEATDELGDRNVSNEFAINVHASGLLPKISYATGNLYSATNNQKMTPTITPTAAGYSYTINKPLPNNLSLDPATGIISGNLVLDDTGYYKGYVVTLTTSGGLKAESNEFDIRIRSNPLPTFTSNDFYVRKGAPFVGPAVGVTGGKFGKLTFSSVAARPAWLHLDEETGSLYGTLPANQNANVAFGFNVHDELTDMTFSVPTKYIRPVNFTVSNSQGTYTGVYGDEISFGAPVPSNNFGPVKYAWQAGSEIPGLSVDPDTGVVSGTLPFGTFSNKIIVAQDDIGTATFYVTVTGNPPPPNLSFADQDITGAEINTYYTTTPVEVAPLLGRASATLTAGTTYSWRLCSSTDEASCGTWASDRQTNSTVQIDPGHHIQLRMKTLQLWDRNYSVRVTVNGTAADWNVRTRVRDGSIPPVDFGPEMVLEPYARHVSPVVYLDIKDPAVLTVRGTGPAFSVVDYLLCDDRETCENADPMTITHNNGNVERTINGPTYIRLTWMTYVNSWDKRGDISIRFKDNAGVAQEFGVLNAYVRSQDVIPDPFDMADFVNIPHRPSTPHVVQITGTLDRFSLKLEFIDWADTSTNPGLLWKVCDTYEECAADVDTGWQNHTVNAPIGPNQFYAVRLTPGGYGGSGTLGLYRYVSTNERVLLDTVAFSVTDDIPSVNFEHVSIVPGSTSQIYKVDLSAFEGYQEFSIGGPIPSGFGINYRYCNSNQQCDEYAASTSGWYGSAGGWSPRHDPGKWILYKITSTSAVPSSGSVRLLIEVGNSAVEVGTITFDNLVPPLPLPDLDMGDALTIPRNTTSEIRTIDLSGIPTPSNLTLRRDGATNFTPQVQFCTSESSCGVWINVTNAAVFPSEQPWGFLKVQVVANNLAAAKSGSFVIISSYGGVATTIGTLSYTGTN